MNRRKQALVHNAAAAENVSYAPSLNKRMPAITLLPTCSPAKPCLPDANKSCLDSPMHQLRRRTFLLTSLVTLAACSTQETVAKPTPDLRRIPLHPNETPALRASINRWADHYKVPRTLVHRLAIRESTHNPAARNGPYYGLLQILPQTARGMGFRGEPNDLLNADTNLKYAVKYLRGAWLLSDGDQSTAISWYARGYYYEAKKRGMLVETGLRPA